MTTPDKTPTSSQNVDDEGFMLQPETWTKDIARILAKGEVAENLTDEHWKLIDCVRQYFLEFGTVPPIRMVVRRTDLSLRRIHELFPNGFARGVCKVAGIPVQILKTTRTLNMGT